MTDQQRTTYEQFQRDMSAIHFRALALSHSIVEEARKTARAAGLSPEMPFLHASNALASQYHGHPWPEVNYSLARKVLWLEKKSFEPSRLADAIWRRRYNRFAREIGWATYSENSSPLGNWTKDTFAFDEIEKGGAR